MHYIRWSLLSNMYTLAHMQSKIFKVFSMQYITVWATFLRYHVDSPLLRICMRAEVCAASVHKPPALSLHCGHLDSTIWVLDDTEGHAHSFTFLNNNAVRYTQEHKHHTHMEFSFLETGCSVQVNILLLIATPC